MDGEQRRARWVCESVTSLCRYAAVGGDDSIRTPTAGAAERRGREWEETDGAGSTQSADAAAGAEQRRGEKTSESCRYLKPLGNSGAGESPKVGCLQLSPPPIFFRTHNIFSSRRSLCINYDRPPFPPPSSPGAFSAYQKARSFA